MAWGNWSQNILLGGAPAFFGAQYNAIRHIGNKTGVTEGLGGSDPGKGKTPNNYDELFASIIPMMAADMGYNLNVTTDENGNRHYDLQPTEATLQRRAQNAEIDRLTYDAQVRALTGQMSLFPQQETFLNDAFNKSNETALAGYNNIMAEIDRGQRDAYSVLKEYDDLITSSGVSRSNALDVVENIMEQGGKNQKDALVSLGQQIGNTDKTIGQQIDASFTKARELAAIGLNDQADQMRQQTAKQAALLGRSPMDPNFQYELQNLTQKNIMQTNLALGQAEAEAKAGLASKTGSKMENLMQQYADLEGKLTGQRANLGMERYALQGDLGNKRMGLKELQTQLAQSYGNQRTGVAQQQAGIMNQLQSTNQQNRYNLAMGLPYQQAQFGMGIQGLESQLRGQGAQNAQGMFGAFSAPYNTESSRLGYARDFWDYLNTIGALGVTAATAGTKPA